MKDEEIERMSEFERNYWWFVGRRKIIHTILQNEIKKKSDLRILDIGCGTGFTTLSLKKFGDIVGTDGSFSALRHCNKIGLNQVIKSDSYYLPFADKTFDMITMLDVLEHIENDLRVLEELNRVLKKDGIIIITVPAYQFLWSQHDVALSHYRRYNIKTLSKVIIKTGFKVIRISYFISFLFPIIAIFRFIKNLNKTNSVQRSNLKRLPPILNNTLQRILSIENKTLSKMNLLENL